MKFKRKDNKRTNKKQALCEAVEGYFKSRGFSLYIDNYKILKCFEKIVGGAIMNNYIEEHYVYQNNIYIKVNSAVVRNELTMAKAQIEATMREKLNIETIKLYLK